MKYIIRTKGERWFVYYNTEFVASFDNFYEALNCMLRHQIDLKVAKEIEDGRHSQEY